MLMMKISPFPIAVFLRLAGDKPISLQLTKAGVEISQEGRVRLASFENIAELVPAMNTLSASLTLRLNDGELIHASWLPKAGAKQFHCACGEKMAEHREMCLVGELAANGPEIEKLACQIKKATAGTQFFRFSHCSALIAAITPIRHFFDLNQERWPQIAGLRSGLSLIIGFWSDPQTARLKNNEKFLEHELGKFGSFFDQIEANPLTAAQRSAVVQGEDNTLVIAGAGSGKTSVVVAKAGYLFKSGACKPEQILLLAFSRDAMEEIQDRLKARLGVAVKTATFHSLGLEIISLVEGTKPSVASEAADSVKMRKSLQTIISDLQADENFAALLRIFFSSYLIPYRSLFDFQSLGEYWEYLQAHEMRSLNGDVVKSMEELEIANFLFLNGINYRYEQPYRFNTATRTKRQYQPDFTISEPEVYIEHFGLDENNRTPHFINQTEYLAGVAWKRELHSQNRTTLIETFSHQKAAGTLLATLEEKLKAAAVVFNPLPPAQIFQKLVALGTIDKFSGLLATFLNHFKSNLHTVDGLRAREVAFKDPERIEAFLNIFEVVYSEYEKRLATADEVDFNDMIARATQHIESGKYVSPYQYVLVDEFQDISIGRARLIKALQRQDPNTRLFCVGDDWQAIYRFAGSDIAIMRNFELEFGHSVFVHLDRTFRYNNQINDLSAKFILKNPKQIPKHLTPHTTTDAKCIWVHWVNNSVGEVLQKVLKGVAQRFQGKKLSVLLLGRYKHEAPDCLPRWSVEFRGMDIEFLTIHRSKGLEADVVIILGLKAGRLGFPSEISDDPLLDLVLSEPESFPEAEERRLFYVALTRAKKEIHLLADPMCQSVFVQELLSEGLKISDADEAEIPQYACPLCHTGIIISKQSNTGEKYYSCTHSPYCNFRPSRCAVCDEGVMLRLVNGKSRGCTNPNCKHIAEACPSCEQGIQVKRSGRFGNFMGCSRYPECEFKAKIGSSGLRRSGR
jgi:DNA helicase-4